MTESFSKRSLTKSGWFIRLVSLYCLLTPLLVLYGWFVDSKELKTWDLIGPAMNPLSAICFLLSGTALYLFITRNYTYARISAAVVILLVVGNIVSLYLGYPIDQLLFTEKMLSEQPPNHMALPTAICFILVSGSFVCGSCRIYKISQVLSFGVAFIAFFVFTAYLYGNRPLYFQPGTMAMALNTSISFLLLSVAVMLLYPHEAYLKQFAGAAGGSRMARRLIPFAILFIVMIGWLRLQFLQAGFVTLEAGLSLFITIVAVAFIYVLYIYTRKINEIEMHLEKEKMHVNHLNKKLSQKNHELQGKNEDLERFVYAVSHDIRSPLSGIRNLSDKLTSEDPGLSEEHREWLLLIKTTSDSLIERTTRMLEFAKAGKKAIKKSPVNTSQIVSQVIDELKAGTESKEIRVQMKSLPVVMADKALLKAVFYNLVSNAVKFTPGHVADVIISCTKKGRENIFSIKDKGMGLDIKSIGNLFRSFTRLPDAEEVKGSGIGLSIVKKIIERHGGRVWAKPGEKGGSIFYFSLPS